jgi:hypothetical protein
VNIPENPRHFLRARVSFFLTGYACCHGITLQGVSPHACAALSDDPTEKADATNGNMENIG